MKKAILVGVAVVGLAASAYAQAPQGQGQQARPHAGQAWSDVDGDGVGDNFGTMQGRRGMRGRRSGAGLAFGRGGLSLVDITAQVTGQDRVAVVASLRAGKTLAQVAEAAGKSAADVKQAALDARKARLDEAVAAGRLTAEEAGAMMTLMEARIDRQLTSDWQAGRRRPGFGRRAAPQAPIGR